MTANIATKTTTYSSMTWPERRFPDTDVLLGTFNIDNQFTGSE